MVINDNNNFAPSLFWSLCGFAGDCFGPRYFSEGAQPPISHNDLKKDSAQLLLSINNLRNCAIQSEEIIFISRK